MFGREHLIEAATKLWGPATSKKSHEWRFGTHGSKSINLNDLLWYDHELEVGGGVVELCEKAGIKPNGHDASTGESGWIFYDYRDEKNDLLFQVVRMPGHVFRQRRLDEHGRPIWKLGNVRRVLYRLHELIHREGVVFVCEGEKDVDNVRALGLVATTNPGGAGKWRPEYNIFLKDRNVVILPHNDEAGSNHAASVERFLFGIAKSIKIIKLPGLGDKEDVSNWIERGGTHEQLEALATAAPEREAPTTDWINLCATTKNGEPLPVLMNVLIALRNDVKLKSILDFNQMLRAPMITRSKHRPVEDDDITDIQEYLQNAGLRRVSRDTVRQAVVAYAGDHPYHPVKNYLDSLDWDRTPRFLGDYLGCERNNYNNAVCNMFLISMVARIYKPGCKVDYMLVLEGPQGVLKSMACRALFGDEYFSDNLPDITSGKDVSVHIRGKWGIEVSELHAFTKAESTLLKQFLSRQSERYRPPYGHMEVDEARQCVFIGTTNNDTYLKDETGGRRFWPLVTGNINIPELEENRDQLLAQAVYEFHEEVPWWPDRQFEREHIAPEQDARYDEDAWLPTIREHLKLGSITETTVAAVASAALNIPTERLGRREQLRIGAILKILKWKKKHTDAGNVWQRPALF